MYGFIKASLQIQTKSQAQCCAEK